MQKAIGKDWEAQFDETKAQEIQKWLKIADSAQLISNKGGIDLPLIGKLNPTKHPLPHLQTKSPQKY
jgi:hypothetical protein